MISDDEISAIKSNLFWASHPAISNWQSFPWHRDKGRVGRVQTHKPHSSQALAIDVFGTIKASEDRDLILDAVARRCGVPDGGPWTMELEWSAPKELLGEMTPTQVDAIAFGRHSTVVIEAKFTEPGGRCSQTKPLASGPHKGMRQCTGSYSSQTNVVNGSSARCALSAKGIRYWDIIPDIFGIDVSEDLNPCPFSGDEFQWMRNSVVAYRLAQTQGKLATTVAAFADGTGLATAKKVRSGGLGHLTTRGTYAVTPMSYQAIIELARSVSARNDIWEALDKWVAKKIELAERR